VIADRDFVNPEVALGALHRNLRLEAEAVRPDGDALEQFSAEDFVASLHVGQMEVAKHITDTGQHLVDHRMAERQHAPLGTDQEARTEDGVGVAVEQGGGEVCQGVASRGQFSGPRGPGRWQRHSLAALPGGSRAEKLI